MRAYFKPSAHILPQPRPGTGRPPTVTKGSQTAIVVGGYLSDLTDDAMTDDESSEDDGERQRTFKSSHTSVPLLKRQKLAIPARTQRLNAEEVHQKALVSALHDIEKLIASKMDTFARPIAHEQYRASCGWSCMENERPLMPPNERQRAKALHHSGVAEWSEYGFESGCVRVNLPKSRRGRHWKTFTPLDDPAICMELRSFVRSNKWSEKLKNFTRDNTLSASEQKYLHNVVDNEIPQGLKRYMELELFPRIQLKVTKGIFNVSFSVISGRTLCRRYIRCLLYATCNQRT